MKNECSAYVYIMASQTGTLYVGSTTDLDWRVFEHQSKKYPKSFTARYDCFKLVYFEEYDNLDDARRREYQIKQGSRVKKEKLIHLKNPAWIDLSRERIRLLQQVHHVPFPEKGGA